MKQIDDAQIVQRFLDREGRLKQIPVKQAKLQAVLAYLATQFEPDRRYSEKDVNETLLRFHPDFCTLRRYLVDTRRLARANGEYWRIGSAPQ